MNIRDALAVLPQYLLPHHPLSRLMHRLARSRVPWWKDWAIRQIIQRYGVDLSEAVESDPAAFDSFNAFFTRALRPEARPIAPEPDAVVCPADGVISQIGRIADGELIQAKGHRFRVVDLLGGEESRALPFLNGHFATIYLSPRDYHRLHMPLAGTLREMVHVPGRLFSVNRVTTEHVPNLFARNERVAALFATDAGPMGLVLVGAIFVASIETVWHGEVTPPTTSGVQVWPYGAGRTIQLERGAEMGRFNMGSTIIVLLPATRIRWDEALQPGVSVRVGQTLGSLI